MSNLTIAGVTLATIVTTVRQSTADNEGFLFGTVHLQNLNTLNDLNILSSSPYLTLALQSFVSTGSVCSFYEPTGILKESQLETLLSKTKQTLLGWYRFRRNTPMRPSMREISVHHNFSKFFENYHRKTSGANLLQTPIFALFSESSTTENKIRNMEYKFLKIPNRKEVFSIKITILNMMSSSENEYREFKGLSPLSTGGSNFPAFKELSGHLSENLSGMLTKSPPPFIDSLEQFYNVTLNKLKELATEVESSNNQIRNLQAELKRLKEKGQK
eukprot:TRINITY_DN15291_c0_g1_i1.p1 TRINITY_DN15291_c0_g1~~TRINITY_DN15291_c0_g1_i1.p1  ORF type:complete len:273 (+),score=22.17 TRINITY_DN15291_c0_g1_i1:20-838(+)